MEFTDAQRKEIAEIAAEAAGILVIAADDARRKRLLERVELDKSKRETRLYLITLVGHHIAFPDAEGRSIMSQSFYALVEVSKEAPSFYSGRVEVVAWGDGKRLKEPVGVVLTGTSIVAMVESSESNLTSSKASAA